MGIIAALYAEFRRLEEELQHPLGAKRWDERTHHYYTYLKTLFHTRK